MQQPFFATAQRHGSLSGGRLLLFQRQRPLELLGFPQLLAGLLGCHVISSDLLIAVCPTGAVRSLICNSRAKVQKIRAGRHPVLFSSTCVFAARDARSPLQEAALIY